MSRMKLSITGQSNQVLRHPIRSCYGMILQACEGNKENSIPNKAKTEIYYCGLKQNPLLFRAFSNLAYFPGMASISDRV